ncbi:glycoside hydrolase family 13 protein [Pirellulaceae bacterium]|nr:glycoside hydrolase family 13 protein [Pirellulaceae bacterium]
MQPERRFTDWHGLETPEIIAQRKSDWRCGPIVYHIFVDRFAPSEALDKKKDLYSSPRILRDWSHEPRHDEFLQEHSVWSHEVEFWGGDLNSVATKIDYLKQLGVECVYLNPIHDSFTNHKYGAKDYRKISPEYGTREQLKSLTKDIHAVGMRIMLDGVFNHMGMQASIFVDARENESSPYRDWFSFSNKYEHGHRGWYNVSNLPELNLENELVRNDLWNNDDSVVASYLKDGIDGWRLDVAFDIGPEYLKELTAAAHRVKHDSWIIGEVWSDPNGWSDSMDGLMNFNFRQLMIEMLAENMSGAQVGRILERQTSSGNYDGLLKSWLILDNHDTPRIKNVLPDFRQRSLAQTLQFCLPGSPCIYYGVEVGMSGGDDPEMRGPMQWDGVNAGNPEFARINDLIKIRQDSPALRYGSIRFLPTVSALAFSRYTDRSVDDVVVVANATGQTITEVITPENPWVLHFTMYHDQLSDFQTQQHSGLLTVEVPPFGIRILKPRIDRGGDYSSYKRLK